MTAGRRALVAAVAATGVRDTRVLDAMRAVDRADFVPPEHVALADLDVPVPIGDDQVTTQPSLIAAMLESLHLEGSETVLEVGTGYGYQTALLGCLVRQVWSIERRADLAVAARRNLAAAGLTNVEIVTGDGTLGLLEHAPFQAIVVCAAFPRVPAPLAAQLADGGRLVQPIGPGGQEEVALFMKDARGLHRRKLVTLARFVPLVGVHGYA